MRAPLSVIAVLAENLTRKHDDATLGLATGLHNSRLWVMIQSYHGSKRPPGGAESQ